MRQINILYPVEGPNPKNDILHVFKGKTNTKNSMGTQKPYLLNYFVTTLRDGSVLTDDFVSHLSWVFTHSHFSWYNLGSLSKDHIRNNANKDKIDILLKVQDPQKKLQYPVAQHIPI